MLAALQADLAAKSAPRLATVTGHSKNTKPSKKKPERKVVLRAPDGSPLITSRGALRGMLLAARHVRTLSPEALEALLLAEEPDDMGESGGLALAGWGRLGELDPRAALALAIKNPKTEPAFYIVLHDWLIRDRGAAVEWFRTQPDSKEKANFMTVAGLVLASSDPGLLSELTGSIEDPALQRKSLSQSIIAQSITDADAALARLGELPEGEARDETLKTLINMHGSVKSRQLLELALPMALENGGELRELTSLLREDSRADPAGTLAWMAGRSPEEIAVLRKNTPGLYSLSALGSLEAPEFQKALQQFPDPADREWLNVSYHASRGSKEPLASLEALSTVPVTDASLRNEAIDVILSRGLRAGQEADFEPWLAARPEAEQAALRAKIAKWKETAAKP